LQNFTDFEPKVIDGIVNYCHEEFCNLKSAALCPCRALNNRPFCVGTHGENGFSGREETDGLRPDVSFLDTFFEDLDKIGNKNYEKK
jgi:CDGSH-type Zn-finger protein